MGSTNKTPNLALSQFSDTDKPTYRGDYNSDMSKIDGYVTDNAGEHTTTRQIANAANVAVGNLQSSVTSMNSDIEAIELVNEAQATALTNLGTAVTDGMGNRYTKAESDARYPAKPPKPIALILGNSHSAPDINTWHEPLGAAMGMDIVNYAVSATGFTYGGANQYINRLEAAYNAMSATDRARVEIVFNTDSGNDVRGKVSVSSAAVALFNRIKALFPNARSICIPLLWSTNNSDNQTQANKESASARIKELRDACITTGTEFIEGSWRWHWGRDDLMNSNDIHYNASGKNWIARYVESYLRGGTTDHDTAWIVATGTAKTSLAASQRYPALSSSRTGDSGTVTGRLEVTTAVAAGETIATIAAGTRPIWDNFAVAFKGGMYSPTEIPVWVMPSGAVQALAAMATGDYEMTFTYPTL